MLRLLNVPKTSQKRTPPIKFIGQGAYGCVFQPFIQCKGSTAPTNAQYISKIQKNTTNIQREVLLGKIINAIANSKFFFAPIIDVCPVNIDVIPQAELQKCDVLSKPNRHTGLISLNQTHEYISSKIRYAGKIPVTKYLLNHLNNPKKMVRYMLRFNVHMLRGLQLLHSAKSLIIHNDIKDGNVIYDEQHGHPIYIDFGLSYQVEDITPEKVAKVFYTDRTYTPWAFEITLLSYISRRVMPRIDITKTLITPQDIRTIKELFATFLAEIEILDPNLELISEPEINLFRKQIHQFIDTFLNKSWKVLFDELVTNADTWDNYSIAVMYLLIILDTILDQNIQPPAWIKSYMAILKTVILAVPNTASSVKRMSVKDTTSKITQLFMMVEKNEMLKTVLHLKKQENTSHLRIQRYQKRSLHRNLKSNEIQNERNLVVQ